MIMAESTAVEDIDAGKVGRQYRCFKVKVLTNHKADQTDDIFFLVHDKKTTYLFSIRQASDSWFKTLIFFIR